MHIQLSDHFSYRKLIRFILPSVAMMIFTSVYGVVDGFFVSNYAGKTPFAAVNLIMPFLIIVAAVGLIFGTGGTAIVAKTLGEGKQKKANLENCVTYARIILAVLPFYVLQLLFQSFFVTAEKPQLGLWVTLSAGAANMILDAVLVILLPLEYKLAGAAAATAASQVIGGCFPLFYFFRRNSSILRLGRTVPDKKAVFKACMNGSSEFMSNVSMSIVGMLYNLQLLQYAGENGVAAYGVMMYVSMIFSAAFIGYSIGVAPVVGYHNGAHNTEELKGLLRKSLYMTGLFGITMIISAELLAVWLADIFIGYDTELMKLTVSGFRIFALSFGFMGFAIFASGFFTALNDGITSALISFLRTLVFQCAAVILLPKIWGIYGIWLSIVVAEFMAVVLGTVFLAAKQKKYHY